MARAATGKVVKLISPLARCNRTPIGPFKSFQGAEFTQARNLILGQLLGPKGRARTPMAVKYPYPIACPPEAQGCQGPRHSSTDNQDRVIFTQGRDSFAQTSTEAAR